MLGLDPSIGNSTHHRKSCSTATNTGGIRSSVEPWDDNGHAGNP
jgi:hypothetical protein